MHKGMVRWLVLAVVVIVLDQITKLYITSHFAYGEVLRVLDVFNITFVYNPGAAFSFLHDAGGWQRYLFTAFALIVSGVIVYLLRKHHEETLFAGAISLVMGGAIGNVIDRMAYGKVVDFLDFHWGLAHFPAFNVADSAICIGAGLMILDGFLKKSEEKSVQQ
ncbi:signal peptidase II [Burkholderiaceae bacterium DAT-1]|nr:signal peptidase II [Burkholderiaceae bacterium DAT-1]